MTESDRIRHYSGLFIFSVYLSQVFRKSGTHSLWKEPKDKFFGEEIAAYVIRSDFNIDADMIKDIVGKKLSLQKVPKYVVFKNEFPMTATGKVKKYMLNKIDIV